MAKCRSRLQDSLSRGRTCRYEFMEHGYVGCLRGPHLTYGDRMRSLAIALCTVVATVAGAQDRDIRVERSGLPRDVAREAARLFNESTATRTNGRLEVDQDRVIEGDVAVL